MCREPEITRFLDRPLAPTMTSNRSNYFWTNAILKVEDFSDKIMLQNQ